VLLDSGIAGSAQASLESAGHEVHCVIEWPRDPGDEEILTRAAADRLVLVTLDKDFGELAVLRGMPHHGIIRLVDISATRQGVLIVAALAAHGDELIRGGIVTIEPGRTRVRPAS
jgi:predicted nuclease of predicted toxin-antitoxin system